MKKIYYLFAFVATAIAFAACHPLDSTYKQLDEAPLPAQTITYNLATTDFSLLDTSVYAHYTHSFRTQADAKMYIPTILNSKYPQVGNGSNANITFTTQIKLADSVYKDVAYTLTNADYLLLPNNKFTDFSSAQILNWLPYKYLAPVDNQLEVLTFNYYSGTTTVQTYSYLYLGGAWQQIYMITPAQYASVGRGGFNQFTSTDDANLLAYFNAILKADLTVSPIAKSGDIKYVSFNYYSSTKITSQRVLTLIYNGTNWVMTGTSTLGFLRTNGTWIADPTVYYTLKAIDTKLIAASSIGTAAQRTNLGQYGDFSGWLAADVQSAMILVLTTDFPTPTPNVNYKITYLNYTGGADVLTTLTFQYNGTAWVAH
ncbi:MAG: hypothetical protein JWP37_4252 [Mucilaginibacter sp.]|nr:hypothetical protein [Mucilaginibacter sp.]